MLDSLNVNWVRQLHNRSVKHGSHRFESDAVRPGVQLAGRRALLLDISVELLANQGSLAIHHLLVYQAVLLFLVLYDQIASLLAKFVVFLVGAMWQLLTGSGECADCGEEAVTITADGHELSTLFEALSKRL